MTTAAYFIIFTLLGIVTASLGPTLQPLANQTMQALSEVSVLFTVRSLGYMAGSFLGGRLYDFFLGNPVMAGAMLLISVSLLLVPFSTVLVVLAVVLFFTGIGEGVVDVGGNTLLSWQHREEVGPYMNGLHFFFGLGAFLSPLLVSVVRRLTGEVAWAYWLIGLLALPAALGLLGVRSPKPLKEPDDDGRIARVYWGLIALMVLFFCLYVGVEVSFSGWIYTYAQAAVGASEDTAAYINSVFWVSFTVARLISIPLGSRLRPRQILLIDVTGAMISLVALLIWSTDMSALWLGSAGLGFFLASMFPTMITFAGKRMPVSGKVTGFFFLGATAGGMSIPWLIGQFFERIGPQFMLWTLAVLMLLVIVVLAVLVSGYQEERIIGKPNLTAH